MDVRIGEMTLDDFDELIAFWSGIEGVGLNESDTPAGIARYLARNPGMSLVARHGGRVVGAVLCGHDGRRGTINHLAVAEGARGRGLGRELVERCIAKLAEVNVAKCNVFVYADNAEGAAFWERMGYKPRADLRVMQRVV
jgi:N-acetylglutamate synthase